VAAHALAGAVSEPAERPTPASVLFAAGVVYTAMAAAALLWLWGRDRLQQLPLRAVGDYGLPAAAGLGLATGVGAALLLALASRRSAGLARCEGRIAAMLGPLSEGQVVALATTAAIAEELFFRLAVLDAIGPLLAVACYAALNTGPGFWPWLPVAMLFAGAATALMQAGFGLLSATTAHALVNYLVLRRILPT
jgi:hypothetical protein